jgi:hypothetical protein
MNLLLAPWRAFVAFWTEPIRAESLAVFRIALGLTILGSQLTGIGPSLALFGGPDGICPAEAHDGWLSRSGRICLLRGPVSLPLLGEWLPDDIDRAYPWLSRWVSPEQARAWADWGTRLSSARLLFAIYLVVLVAFTAGFWTRTSTFLALLLAATFNHRFAEMMNGGDALFRNGLYFLLLSPAGAVWSIDRLLRDRRDRRAGGLPAPAPTTIPPWSVRLMQIHVAVMYLFTGLTKLRDVHFEDGWLRGDWIDGTALYWVFNDVAITRWSYAQLPVPMPICRLMTWATLVFEIGFGLLMLIRPLRFWVLLFGVSLHVGILLIMEIGWFSQVTLCWYLLFVPGDRLADLVGQLRFRPSALAGGDHLPAQRGLLSPPVPPPAAGSASV